MIFSENRYPLFGIMLLALAQEPGELAGLAVGPPEHGRGFDQALGTPEGADQGDHDSAAQRGCLQMVVEPDLDVGPVALIGLIPDGEVEIPDVALDRMAQQLVQMRATGPKAHDLAVMIARQHEIVAAAVDEPQARCRDGRADIEAADVSDAAQRGRGIEPERAIAWPREQILDAHAREGPR